jgi:cytochrome d ubiquinol oxidase subunit I
LLYPTDWIAVIFNPSFPYRFVHMVTAAYLTTAFVVGGVGGYYLWRGLHVKHARVMLGMAMIMAVFVAPLQLLFGDMHGLNTFKHQPAKVAAMEGLWDTEKGAGLKLFAWPDQIEERNRFEVTIPKLSSLILTHDLDGEVKGLKAWPRIDRPPVALVFWTFRLMVGLGMLMIATGVVALVLHFKKQLFTTRWFHLWCMAMTPAGFVAVAVRLVCHRGRPAAVYRLSRCCARRKPLRRWLVGPLPLHWPAFVITYGLVFRRREPTTSSN